MTQPDSLRGTPLARYAGMTADSECQCSHTFGRHMPNTFYGARANEVSLSVEMRCTVCPCIAFTTYNEREIMANTAQKSAEGNGIELGRKYAGVFVIRQDASYQAKVELGMYFAGQQGLSLENGAAFVTGFVAGISNDGKRTAGSLTLEEKIDLLLTREVDKQLSDGNDSGGANRPDVSAD